MGAVLVALLVAAPDPAALHALARDYYTWRDRADPVGSSDQGLHTGDAELSDPAAFVESRKHVDAVLAQVAALRTDGWSKDERVDAILLRAQLERDAFCGRGPSRRPAACRRCRPSSSRGRRTWSARWRSTPSWRWRRRAAAMTSTSRA